MPTTSCNFKPVTPNREANRCYTMLKGDPGAAKDSFITSQGTNPCRRMSFYVSIQDNMSVPKTN